MNSEQLKQLDDIAELMYKDLHNAYHHSLPPEPENSSAKASYLKSFYFYLKTLNETVERFHMDNENEITSELI